MCRGISIHIQKIFADFGLTLDPYLETVVRIYYMTLRRFASTRVILPYIGTRAYFTFIEPLPPAYPWALTSSMIDDLCD
jgi:hypothetical protein